MRVGSMFSGYGGGELAVQMVWPDARPVWFVESASHQAMVLAAHWPDVPNYGDVTSVDWSQVPGVDVLTAGYPCQPFSHAGNRKGAADERHLWPYVADAVRVLRPRLVLLENVAGHLSLGFDRVLADLAELGFDAEWGVVRASDAGSTHRRARLFVAAYPQRVDRQAPSTRQHRHVTDGSPIPVDGADGRDRAAADAGGERHGRREDPPPMGRVDGSYEG